MESIDFIAICIFAIAVVFVVLLIYLIPLLKQLRKTAETAEKTLDNLEKELIPLIRQMRTSIDDINQITQGLKQQVSAIENVIERFRGIAERAHQISSLVYDQVELPILNVLNNINAFKKGISTFLNALMIRRKEG